MTIYLSIGNERINISDQYFTPEEGMIIHIEEKGVEKSYKVRIKTIIRKIGSSGDVEQELICSPNL